MGLPAPTKRRSALEADRQVLDDGDDVGAQAVGLVEGGVIGRSGLSMALTLGARAVNSSKSTRISIRARLAPRQKCGPPPPKAMCSFGERRMSKANGSTKCSSSRLADEYQRETLSPSLICWPC